MDVGPFGAPALAAIGGFALAALPQAANASFRAGLPIVALASLAATAAWLPTDAVRSGFALALAGLGATLSFGFDDPGFGGIRGARLRLARAWPAMMLAACLAAALATGPGAGFVALAACGLLAAVAAGCTRGEAASRAGWALLRVQAVAIGVGMLGIAAWTVSAPAGAGLTVLGAAILGGAAPFGGALARALGRTAPPLAAMVAGLLPLVSFAILLRVRLELLQAGYGAVADAALLASGLLAMLLGAASASRGEPEGRDAGLGAGLGGLAFAGFGLGGQAGTYAGLICLLARSVAAPAAMLARTRPNSRLRSLTLLFAAGAPPAGLFAGLLLLVEAAGRLAPLLVLALCPLLALSLSRRRVGGAERSGVAVKTVLVTHAVLSLAIGVALPQPVGARLFDIAVALSGGS